MRRGMLVGLTVALFIGISGTAASAATAAPPANPWPTTPVAATITPTGPPMWIVRANGTVPTRGIEHRNFYGDAHGLHLAQPITGIAATPTGKGYWLPPPPPRALPPSGRPVP